MAPIDVMNALICERNSIQDNLQRLEAKLVDHPTNPLDDIKTDRLLQKLKESTASLEDCHTRIRQYCKEEEIDEQKKIYWDLCDFTDLIHVGLTRIMKTFDVANPSSNAQPHNPPASILKLPQIQLRQFDGDFQDWLSFRDLFIASIHSNKNLSPVQKLTYLKSYVTGEAGKLIQSITLTDDNYSIAMEALKNRYENNREIFLRILKRFYSQDMSQPSSSGMRSLIDTTKECFRSLESINLKMDDLSSAMVFYFLLTKLDVTSRQLWEQSLKGTSIPSLDSFYDFLEQRARALGSVNTDSSRNGRGNSNPRKAHVHHGQSSKNCRCCNKSPHALYKCQKFLSMSIADKYNVLKQLSRCFNCFGEGHSGPSCTHGSCRTCNGKHHTLLHKSKEPASVVDNPHATPVASNSKVAAIVDNQATSKNVQVLHSNGTKANQSMLATAVVKVVDCFGFTQKCRALLDGGSTASFITNACAQRLGLRKRKSDVAITGLSSALVGTAKYSVTISFSPHFSNDLSYSIEALVLTKVTESLPSYSCDTTGWSHLKNIQLADPVFNKPAPIDVLLGSDVFWDILKGDRKSGPTGSPLAISSTIGWLVAGSHNPQLKKQLVRAHFATPTLKSQLQAFWELETIPSRKLHTAEESQCEADFATNHSRDSEGRFSVRIPYRVPTPALGCSKTRALQCLKSLERRFQRDPTHLKEYKEFMQDYISLRHMSLIANEEISNPKNPTYYIPHHFVLKDDSTTTKLRVVFNAAAKTDNGLSLNDIMLVGPKLQDDLVNIIMRFRIHPIAFTADIAKMYRQVKVSSSDADLQRILWREDPSDDVKEYRLNTVTYGTASAPYLAVKVLHQLADDEASALPLAHKVTKKAFYVDDLMLSVPTINAAQAVQSELLELMKRGGLSLRKWVSNSPEVLNSLPEELRETKFLLDMNLEESVKAFGIRWNTKQDTFEFRYSAIESSSSKLTKRRILSEMSKLFDPLGWLSPIIISAKILMQSLWKLQSGWDDCVPEEIENYWISFKADLKTVDQISIPGCLIPSTHKHIELAGFCDASEKAYGAVVYLRAFGSNSCNISLLGSKTRVAPTKQISLPRLELCGALLLSNLMESIQEGLDLPITETRAWTDSTVVLAWLKSPPSRWKTFIANRVSAIQEYLPFETWSHVPGSENPADCCSRGLKPLNSSRGSTAGAVRKTFVISSKIVS